MKLSKGFRQARIASKRSDFHAQHLGAAVFYKGSVLAVGYNTEKTHTSQMTYNKYRDFDETTMPAKLHAEVMALNKIKYLDIDFSKVSLYVWRGKDEWHPRISKPCKACEEYIKSLGIRNVFYTGNGSYCHEKYVLFEK